MDQEKSVAGQINEICLRLLTYREHSRQELLRKLIDKGFSVDTVEPVLNALALKDLQSDERYASSYARQRMQKGYGPNRINYELRQRGIAVLDWDEVVFEVADSWLDLLTQTYLKKYAVEPSISRLEWAKRSRFLLQRGFSAEMIKNLLKHLQLKFE